MILSFKLKKTSLVHMRISIATIPVLPVIATPVALVGINYSLTIILLITRCMGLPCCTDWPVWVNSYCATLSPTWDRFQVTKLSVCVQTFHNHTVGFTLDPTRLAQWQHSCGAGSPSRTSVLTAHGQGYEAREEPFCRTGEPGSGLALVLKLLLDVNWQAQLGVATHGRANYRGWVN